MAIKTRKLENGDRGVKVTVKNFLELANWINERGGAADAIYYVDGNGDQSRHRVKVRTKKGWRVANVGDVIIVGEGQYRVQKANEFQGFKK